MAEPQQPNPAPASLPAPGSGEPPFRRLDCQHYDNCLDIAIIRRWDSWTCASCEAYQVSPAEQEIIDSIKARRMGGVSG